MRFGADRTAVCIIKYIAVIGWGADGVNAIYVHISFHQTAAQKTGKHFPAGYAPKAKSTNQIVACIALHNGVPHSAGAVIHPGAAHIVGKADQGIKLALGQLQIILGNKFVNFVYKAGNLLGQKLLCLFPGDTMLTVVAAFILRAFGAVAYSPLAIVPFGIEQKSLHTFNHGQAGLTKGKRSTAGYIGIFRGLRCGLRSGFWSRFRCRLRGRLRGRFRRRLGRSCRCIIRCIIYCFLLILPHFCMDSRTLQ